MLAAAHPLPEAPTLAFVAHRAVAKSFKRWIAPEAEVLQDRDPEPLHQMRVGLRRLRSTLSTFAPAIVLPTEWQGSSLRLLNRALGQVRDLDVLLMTLTQDYLPQLPAPEQKHLQKAIRKLSKRRYRSFQILKTELQHQRYRRLKKALNHWLKHPQTQPLASQPLALIGPDLLLSLTSQVFLHPGWWLQNPTPLQPPAPVPPAVLAHWHDLRKQIKALRYELELLSPFYATPLDCLQPLRQAQETLGNLQDLAVCQAVLEPLLAAPLTTVLPTLVLVLRDRQHHYVQAWEPLRLLLSNSDQRCLIRQQLSQMSAPMSDPMLAQVSAQVSVLPEAASLAP